METPDSNKELLKPEDVNTLEDLRLFLNQVFASPQSPNLPSLRSRIESGESVVPLIN